MIALAKSFVIAGVALILMANVMDAQLYVVDFRERHECRHDRCPIEDDLQGIVPAPGRRYGVRPGREIFIDKHDLRSEERDEQCNVLSFRVSR